MANSDIKPYPLMFDPSQFANKYSPFAGQALPFMGLYSGGATGPTDAHGNPIQSYQQAQAAHDAWQPPAPAQTAPPVTLNTNPTNMYQPWASMGLEAWGNLTPAQRMAASPQIAYSDNPRGNADRPGGSSVPTANMIGTGTQPQQAAAPVAAPTNPINMNAAYLQALSNPGKVTTPGANVAQSPSPSAQSGVLQQFLQNWQPGANPAGNYNPSLFPNALRGQV